jgi:hypothetical protein
MSRVGWSPGSLKTSFSDGPTIDAFGNLRVSNPQQVYDGQLTYDLLPLVFEQITNGSGASIAHNVNNREADMAFSSTPAGGQAIMQNFEYHHYQPGKSQKATITFNFKESVPNCLKFAGYSDGVNGIQFETINGVNQISLYSGTDAGNITVPQSQWNLNKFPALDISVGQILVIDLQALYRGKVRVGFDTSFGVIYVHEFRNANITSAPYIQIASLPIRCGMTCTDTVTTTMNFTCGAVISEGGQENLSGNDFRALGSVVAANGVETHALSVRPKPLYNGFTNRITFRDVELEVGNFGSNPIRWDLVIGQALSGTTAFLDVNTTYSAFEYNALGTKSGSPLIYVDSGFVTASNQSKNSISQALFNKYPITLDAAGNVRLNGTLAILVSGDGGSSDCRVALKWKEIR